MKIKEVIGIDVSKLSIDCCIHSIGLEEVFVNDPKSMRVMVDWALEKSKIAKENLLFVFEHTGLYSYQLVQYLGNNGYLFQVVPGLEIKRSLGITRGKDDRADAKRIALYGHRNREDVKPYQIPDQV